MKTLILIDSNAIIHRAYHALPKNLANAKGELTNVTYGYALALIKILEELRPDYIAAAFDLAGPTFRHIEYKEYKATRVKADQELYDQIPRVREMLAAFGIPIYAVEGFEADDVIGTIVEQCAGKGSSFTSVIPAKAGISYKDPRVKPEDDKRRELMVYIASGDRDVFQLLNGNVAVLLLRKGFNEAEIFDHNHLKAKYNLDPEDFIDLKALMGDASDNIPGIPGIGPKIATDLIQRFDTLEKLYQTIASLLHCSIADLKVELLNDETMKQLSHEMGIKSRILQLIVEYREQAFVSQRLATIRRDVPIKFDPESARWGNYDREKVRALFEELEFKSLLRRFSKDYEVDRGLSRQVGTVPSAGQKKKDEQLKLEL